MTPPENNNGSNIGLEYYKNLYKNTKVKTRDPQPIYILARDTIRTFLHEKKDLLGLRARVLGLIGIEITLISALATAQFSSFWKLGSHIVLGLFTAFTLIVGLCILASVLTWIRHFSDTNIDSLADDLGSRGTEICPERDLPPKS